MLRRISTSFVLAALVATGSAFAVRTDVQAAGQAAARPAPAPLTPADAKLLLGTWQIPLETPTGRLVANIVFRVEAGKVVAGVSAPQFPEHKITDITKTGQVITLKASTEYSGALTAYSGPVSMVLTLTPKGPDMAAWFDFNDSGFQIGGTARKS